LRTFWISRDLAADVLPLLCFRDSFLVPVVVHCAERCQFKPTCLLLGPFCRRGFDGFSSKTVNPFGRFKAGTALMAFKYFTDTGLACATYDDINGIPDVGPGSPCNFSKVPTNGRGQSPHILNYAIY
jgi:hypothetical protein